MFWESLCLPANVWSGWAQAIAGGVVAFLAIDGPRRERNHQSRRDSNLILQRQLGILAVVKATVQRLGESQALIATELNATSPDLLHLQRIRTLLTVDDQACTGLPMADLLEEEVISCVTTMAHETRLLILAVDVYLDANGRPRRPAVGIVLTPNQITEIAAAGANLKRCNQSLKESLDELSRRVNEEIDKRNRELRER
jgi:hypothetical protein